MLRGKRGYILLVPTRALRQLGVDGTLLRIPETVYWKN